MAFNNAYQSHEHSLETLSLIYGYDDYLDSLKVICDMGCGAGLDAQWWATLENREEPPEPYNYRVYAVDRSLAHIDDDVRAIPNIRWIESDYSELVVPEGIDLLWSHDSFQYSLNPLHTLANWNRQMNENGMLLMSLPQNVNYVLNRLNTRTEHYCYFNHNISSLVYMLAVNGFDCKDAYFYKNVNTNWLHCAVYKTQEPMDPATTSMYDLADKGLLHDSVVASLNRYGHLRQEDIIYPWLDQDFYLVKS
jgi:SAM-dependent methyltransferase